MSIIFVGSTVDRETLKELPDASVAGNKMELGFVKGFASKGIRTAAISVEAHAMWRFNGRPVRIKQKHLSDGDVEIETIPYLNLPFIKQITIMVNLKKKIKKRLKMCGFEGSTLVVYNTMTIFAAPVLSIAKKRKIKSIAIVADLPIQTRKNWIQKAEDKRQQKAIGKFSAIIPLTKHIAEEFAPDLPYCVIEAGCDPNDYCNVFTENKICEKKRIVFSGTLNEMSGIELILEVMAKLQDKNIELHIYGDGSLKPFVLNALEKLNNVNYHGRVPNDEMMEIQRNADLLVCPRRSDNFTTRYTFPSKVLEYICSGVPVLSNRLEGIPDEYGQYINYAESETCEDWTNAIISILCEEEYWRYHNKARHAREIALTKKTWKAQVGLLIDVFRSKGLNLE